MKNGTPDVVRVMLRLSTEYPGDLGILMPLVLNLLMLKTGQAFFMTVDEPHAYLRGDILEARTQRTASPKAYAKKWATFIYNRLSQQIQGFWVVVGQLYHFSIVRDDFVRPC